MEERSGISGTVRWAIDSNGALLFEPAYGNFNYLLYFLFIPYGYSTQYKSQTEKR